MLAPTQRITQAGVAALFALFGTKQWETLPHATELESDVEFAAIAHEFGIDRSRTARQFVKWKEWGQAAHGADASGGFDRTPVRVLLDERISDNGAITDAAFDKLLSHFFVQDRPFLTSGETPLLSAIAAKGRPLFIHRIIQFGDLFVKNYAPAASKQRRCSTQFAVERLETQFAAKSLWVTDPALCKLLLAFARSPAFADVKMEKHEFESLLFTYIDDFLFEAFSSAFAPRATLSLDIPPLGDRPQKHVAEVLYYISGYVLSALLKASKQSGAGGLLVFDMFVAMNTVNPFEAEAAGLELSLVAQRTHGSLLFASPAMYEFIVALEHAYSSLLTLTNVAGFGPDLMLEVNRKVGTWKPAEELFQECLRGVRARLAKQGFEDFDATSLHNTILKTFMRMRGKDFLRTLISRYKKSADVTNTTRGSLAAAASSAAKKAKRGSKAAAENVSSSSSSAGAECDDDDGTLGAMEDDLDDALESLELEAFDGQGADEDAPILTPI